MPQQQPVELILFRQMAGYLDTPVFLVGPDGELLYFNEAAEPLLGVRFDEVGEMRMPDWLAAFRPSAHDGRAIPPDEVPLVVALRRRRAVQERLLIVDRQGTLQPILTTAFPLRGQSGRILGAVAFFWPDEEPPRTPGFTGHVS